MTSRPCMMCWGRPERPETLAGTELEEMQLCGRCGVSTKTALAFLQAHGWLVISPGEVHRWTFNDAQAEQRDAQAEQREQGDPSPEDVDPATGEIAPTAQRVSRTRKEKGSPDS